MALVYDATLTPTKRDLLNSWLPTKPWFASDAKVAKLRAYRFDDPAGAVGVEAFVLDVGNGDIVHVPLTYRDTPLDGADEFLITTAEHSTLGKRWVYDGCGDPVWAAALATAIRTGGTEATWYFERDGELIALDKKITVKGSGTENEPISVPDSVRCHSDGPTTVISTGDLDLVVVHIAGTEISAKQTLVARWDDNEAVLAGIA